MKKIIIVIISVVLTACAYTPSTILINEKGETYRCAAWGQGIGGLITAKGIHDTCVSDAELIGYVAVPRVIMGFEPVKSNEHDKSVRIDTVTKGLPAEQAGMLKGDIIKKIGNQDITSNVLIFKALQGKKEGDIVSVEVERDEKLTTLQVTLVERKI